MIDEQYLVVRVYGDSLGMPRATTGIRFYDTYSELVCKWLRSYMNKSVYLYNRSKGAVGIKDLFGDFCSDSEYFGKLAHGILIIQLGIVDCAPRLLPVWVKKRILTRLPVRLNRKIRTSLRDHRPTLQMIGISGRITQKDDFLQLYKKWLVKGSEDFSMVLAVNILPTTVSMEKHSPGLSERIRSYNELIKEAIDTTQIQNVALIDIHGHVMAKPEDIELYVMREDGHHLTIEGHKAIANLITAELQKTYAQGESAWK